MHDGIVYTWGDPRYGALGRQEDEGFNVPSKIRVLENHKIVKIASGGFLTGALTDDGRLFMWGVTRPGGPQLASSAQQESVILQHVADLVSITVLDIAMGDNHALALVSDGRVFGLGDGVNGEFGSESAGFETFAASWSQVPTPPGYKVKSVSCGRQSTFLICASSEPVPYLAPSGDATEILTHVNNESRPAPSNDHGGQPRSVEEGENDVESDISDSSVEGPSDWFGG
ncbi:MAG: hypothetical protein M1821_003570 [Bathelium mastoideum]|nr:MAG: hypothetical protein M1821_003570 [Bathelium mastoideum]